MQHHDMRQHIPGVSVTAFFPRHHTHTSQHRLMLLLFLTLARLLHPIGVKAQMIDPLPFQNTAQEERFQHLTRQLRCMVCQNQSLANSDAPLAQDMRHVIFRLMQQGQTDAQIRRYLVHRYSSFVLYKPPLQPSTWLLWLGPIMIFLAGSVAVTGYIRRSRAGRMPYEHHTQDWEDDW